jgi:hypothetical protein
LGVGELKIIGINSGEVSVTEAGGKHAELKYRFDLIDSKALFKLAAALHEGSVKYGDENWRKVPVRHQLKPCINAYICLPCRRHAGGAHCTCFYTA